jgi:hypothetical protein
MYGACDSESMRLVLIVEAQSMDDARVHVGLVSPLVGIRDSESLVVIPLDSVFPGVPTFLKAFFSAGNIAFNRARVAPGSCTLQ